MDPVAEIFARNIIIVYFFYGLAFFIMGLVLLLESRRASEFRIVHVFGFLAAFGIIHGLHEWFEMFQKLSQAGATNIPDWLLLNELRIPHLVISFSLLVIFGVRLLYATYRKDGNEHRFAYLAAGVLLAVWLISALVTNWIYDPPREEFVQATDVLARYIIGIPGALLAAWAIVLERRNFRARGMAGFGRDLQWAAWALLLYGVVGQAFPGASFLFPSNIINSELFLRIFGFPIQLFRAVEAALMAFFFIRALRAFEVERQNRLKSADKAKLVAQQDALETQKRAQHEAEKLNKELEERGALLGELLHQVVTAQESERERIARELHDGTGQILTGLGLGLAAAEESAGSDPGRATRQLAELKRLNAQALQEVHNVIGDLRPSVLDDLGLVAAFQSQVRQFESRTGVEPLFEVRGKRRRVRPEIETVVFRIGQEALTNVAKHANARTVNICLDFDERRLRLAIQDDGSGFDPEQVLHSNSERRAWGLLGIQERVALVGGTCEIESYPGTGTTIKASVPLIEERFSNA
jgi:signal transduction histidine kinase